MKNKKIRLLFIILGFVFCSSLVVNAQINSPINNQLPVISFTSPSSGMTFNTGQSITLSVSASDPDGTIDLVTIFEGNANGTVLKTFNAPPYTTTVSRETAGSYIYSAQAIDNSGGVSVATVSINVVQPGGNTGGGGLVPCDNCTFDDLLTLINKVVDFLFRNMIIPIAAIAFAYAGFELVTSGGNTSKKEKAKDIFLNVALGLVFAAAAFLIVKTILSALGYDQDWNWFGFE